MVFCPMAGMCISSYANRSCPATFLEPLLGSLASLLSFCTRIAWLCRTWTWEYCICKFSSLASASGIVYTIGGSFKHPVVHLSLLNITLWFAQSIVGLCSLNQGIPRTASWLLRFAT